MPIPHGLLPRVRQVQVFRGLDEVVSAPFEAVGMEVLRGRGKKTEGSWPFFFPGKKKHPQKTTFVFTIPFLFGQVGILQWPPKK